MSLIGIKKHTRLQTSYHYEDFYSFLRSNCCGPWKTPNRFNRKSNFIQSVYGVDPRVIIPASTSLRDLHIHSSKRDISSYANLSSAVYTNARAEAARNAHVEIECE